MAEGVDNDMSQQQQQDCVPHGQEAFHTPSVHFESSAFDAANTPSIEVTVSSSQPGVSQGPKKKSAFQITSVTETRAHSRGDSNGYDAEDLNESDVTEIQIETIEDSTTGNGNGGSRFKVVRIQNKEPYKRGRWLCRDFEQPTPSTTSSIHSADSREVHSTSTASSNFFTSNHVSSDASNAVDQYISNHKNTVEVTFNYKPGQTPCLVSTNSEALRKRDSEPQVNLASASLKSDHVDLSSSKPIAPAERIEKLAEAARLQGITSPSETVQAGDELPIVNTIASAMDKITEIKSALLTVVHEEVQTLKDTIKKLKEENEELKEENEKLKQIVDHQQ